MNAAGSKSDLRRLPLVLLRRLGATYAAIGMLFLSPTQALPAAPTRPLVAEEDTVRNTAKAKYRHVLTNSEPGDPLSQVLPEVFCRSVRRLEVPDLCGARTSRAPMYVVDVLPVTHGSIWDVFAVSTDGRAFSILERGGMQRWLDDRGARCSSPDDLIAVAVTHLRLAHSPDSLSWKPTAWCDRSEDALAIDVCTSPRVISSEGSLVLTTRVKIQEGTRLAALEHWETWQFEISGEWKYSGTRIDASPREPGGRTEGE